MKASGTRCDGAHIIPESLSTLAGSQILTEKLLGENVGRVVAVLKMRLKAHTRGQRAERVENSPEQEADHDGAPFPPEYDPKGQRQEKQRVYDEQRIQTHPVVAERQKDLRAVRVHAVQKNMVQNEQIGHEPRQRQRPVERRRTVGGFWDAPAVHQPGDEARRKASPKPPMNEWVIPRWYSMYCSGVWIKKTSISGEAATSAAHAGSHQLRFPGRAQPMAAPLKACVIGSIAFLPLQKREGAFLRKALFPCALPSDAAYHGTVCWTHCRLPLFHAEAGLNISYRAHVPHSTGK